jgi:hypothetical protein
MSKRKHVEYRGRAFWGYDVALGIFLKHLIDAAEPLITAPSNAWLGEGVSCWRTVATVGDIGLEIDSAWSAEQIGLFLGLAEQACNILATRDTISAEEIEAWPILDDLHIFPRGAAEVRIAPVVELGRAVISLIDGTLPPAPTGEWWFFGTPEGRKTIRMMPTAPAG